MRRVSTAVGEKVMKDIRPGVPFEPTYVYKLLTLIKSSLSEKVSLLFVCRYRATRPGTRSAGRQRSCSARPLSRRDFRNLPTEEEKKKKNIKIMTSARLADSARRVSMQK